MMRRWLLPLALAIALLAQGLVAASAFSGRAGDGLSVAGRCAVTDRQAPIDHSTGIDHCSACVAGVAPILAAVVVLVQFVDFSQPAAFPHPSPLPDVRVIAGHRPPSQAPPARS